MSLAVNARGRAPRVPELIASRENRWLKQFRAALAGEKLRESGPSTPEIIGVEGPHLVESALRAKLRIAAVLFSESGARHLAALGNFLPESGRLLSTSDRLFAQIAATEAPQGVAALVEMPQTGFDDLMRGVPLLLIMAGVQDPGNVGTLLRTAEAFGASGVATSAASGTGTADPFGPKALRASAGSALRLPVLRGVAVPVLMAQLRIAGVRVYATAASTAPFENMPNALPPWEINWRKPAALLLGNEGAGLSAELLRSSDAIIHIPQATPCEADTPVDSLNVAVAGGIVLYEAARQRGFA
jgi:TrmH family RNA methyltransferase